MLEQMTNLAKSASVSQSLGLIGRTVSYVDAEGLPVTGTVDSVAVKKDTASLTVDGRAGIDPSKVSEIS
jgi:hypothetical protein